jgi:hypothetical protein
MKIDTVTVTRDILRQGHAHFYVTFHISGSIQARNMILVSIFTNLGKRISEN